MEKKAGWLLVAGTIWVIVPYSLLILNFGYPDILRESPSVILVDFHQKGKSLIFTWFAFALSAWPLLFAFIALKRKYGQRSVWIYAGGIAGIIGALAQMAGLLRWVFIVPLLAQHYSVEQNSVVRQLIEQIFVLVHQAGGVMIGEHIGQLFTIVWIIATAEGLYRLGLTPITNRNLGWISGGIYLMAQAELLQTVIPGFPVWKYAGLAGSLLWLIWQGITGIVLIRNHSIVKTMD